jgi:class 3 adenylate cyclase
LGTVETHPETRYTSVGDLSLAYQVIGEGSSDLVFVPDWFTHVEAQWEERRSERFLRRLASLGRLIVFDKRGTGLSDPIPLDHLPTVEEWVEDLRLVLDAVSSSTVALVCASGGTFLGLSFAAMYPERVRALVVIDGSSCHPRREDYPEGVRPESLVWAREWVRRVWGTGKSLEFICPSLINDHAFVAWRARYERTAASPGVVRKMFDLLTEADVRHVLPAISAPTLVLHRTDDLWVRAAQGRYIAERIRGARLLELPGTDHIWLGEDMDRLADEVEEFLTGKRPVVEPDRVLATLLFTDIVASTKTVTDLGDRHWRELLDRHHAVVRQQLERFGGSIIATTGDGFLARFDGPARAIRCACAVRDAVNGLGLDVRAGVHTGEVELREGDVAGIGVHIGARIGALAEAGEVLVSRTVVDLVAGSGIEFSDRGEHELKGIRGTWQLFSVME